jgi:hypothetical protein
MHGHPSVNAEAIKFTGHICLMHMQDGTILSNHPVQSLIVQSCHYGSGKYTSNPKSGFW